MPNFCNFDRNGCVLVLHPAPYNILYTFGFCGNEKLVISRKVRLEHIPPKVFRYSGIQVFSKTKTHGIHKENFYNNIYNNIIIGLKLMVYPHKKLLNT